MSPPCVNAVLHVLQNELKPGGVRVLNLGYSDILLDARALTAEAGLEGLEVRPDSKSIAKHHGYSEDLQVPTCESFFKALGVEVLDTVDVKEWRGGEICLDLNKPLEQQQQGLPLHPGGYDLILDLGTIEHVFNAPEALKTINKLLNVGGFVIHWNPAWMPNHGFYNFSPTFYADWYKNLGYSLVSMVLFTKDEKTGMENSMIVPPTARFSFPTTNSSNLCIVKKEKEVAFEEWPVQTKYKNMGILEK